MSRLAEYAEARELTLNLTLRELRSRYRRSVLGWTWSLLNPLSTVVVYSVVFSFFLKIEPPVGDPSGLHSFAMFLVCGLLPWNYFTNSVSQSMDALLGNANLIRKVYFPREVTVVANVGSLLVTLLVEFGVVCVILLALGNMVLPWIPVLLVIIAVQSVFVLGIGLLLAPLNVYFRDLKHFVGIALQALFYSAPIVYPQRLVPEHANLWGWEVPLRSIYEQNPLVRFVDAYRDVLYDLRFPSLGTMVVLALWAGGLLAFGLFVFSRLDRRLAEEV
jgi:ABC-2 type transport system permease protein